MKLVFTDAALDDLRSIRDYTLETWGAEQEALYLNRLWARIESVRSDPLRYRLREELFPGCRIASEGRHVLLFRVGDEALEIVRVLHSAMDFKRQARNPGVHWSRARHYLRVSSSVRRSPSLNSSAMPLSGSCRLP